MAIPQPRPVEIAPPPPAPPAPPPAVSACMVVRFSGFDELAVVLKRTYAWRPGEAPRRAEAQEGLRDQPEPWPEPLSGRGPSHRHPVDGHGWRSGCDLLVHGTARSPRPTPRLDLAVAAGGRTVRAVAWGVRRIERRGATWAFSAPEAFTELVLRDEQAYGGRDRAAEDGIAAAALARMRPEQARRAAPAMAGIFRGAHPLAYPRNPHGLGYALADAPGLAGCELPRFERADDQLSPARLILPAPFGWVGQPVPPAWGGLPPAAFPRIAMLGLPPPGYDPGGACPEVARGWLPPGFCRGNLAAADPSDQARLIDPLVASTADPELRFPALAPGSRLDLAGFAPGGLATAVPADRPAARLPDPAGGKRPAELALTLNQLALDVDALAMTAVFTARLRLSGPPLTPARLAELGAALRILDGAA